MWFKEKNIKYKSNRILTDFEVARIKRLKSKLKEGEKIKFFDCIPRIVKKTKWDCFWDKVRKKINTGVVMGDFKFEIGDTVIVNGRVRAKIKSRFATPMGNFYECKNLLETLSILPRVFQVTEKRISADTKMEKETLVKK